MPAVSFIKRSEQLSNQLRTKFAIAMSQMYRQEVPQYNTLLSLVAAANQSTLIAKPELKANLLRVNNLHRLELECHGAIRVGKAEELFHLRRLFNIMGMYPVAYYDLAVAGIPVHSTAFRPINREALSENTFRVFTSLLRTDLIADKPLREKAQSVLKSRQIFSTDLLNFIQSIETNNGMQENQLDEFIEMAVNVFRWHEEAIVDAELYQELHDNHRLVADVVSFKGPHINHLTPVTLDIDKAQQLMAVCGIEPKAVVEGPPQRECPILLRQTSFKALQEAIKFPSGGEHIVGSHTARFGEIEQRGIALTIKGQDLYDRLLSKTRDQIKPHADGSNAEEYIQLLATNFREFPDSYAELRSQKLAYFYYSVCENAAEKNARINNAGQTIDQLIEKGFVKYDPVIYEDFLPVSAAGIFQSNLGDASDNRLKRTSNQKLFEKHLGTYTIDRFALYQKQQEASIETCLKAFN